MHNVSEFELLLIIHLSWWEKDLAWFLSLSPAVGQVEGVGSYRQDQEIVELSDYGNVHVHSLHFVIWQECVCTQPAFWAQCIMSWISMALPCKPVAFVMWTAGLWQGLVISKDITYHDRRKQHGQPTSGSVWRTHILASSASSWWWCDGGRGRWRGGRWWGLLGSPGMCP